MSCNKVKLSKKEALSFIKKFCGTRQYRKEKRAYYCEECNNWHTTSTEDKIEIIDINLINNERWNKLLKKSDC